MPSPFSRYILQVSLNEHLLSTSVQACRLWSNREERAPFNQHTDRIPLQIKAPSDPLSTLGVLLPTNAPVKMNIICSRYPQTQVERSRLVQGEAKV